MQKHSANLGLFEEGNTLSFEQARGGGWGGGGGGERGRKDGLLTRPFLPTLHTSPLSLSTAAPSLPRRGLRARLRVRAVRAPLRLSETAGGLPPSLLPTLLLRPPLITLLWAFLLPQPRLLAAHARAHPRLTAGQQRRAGFGRQARAPPLVRASAVQPPLPLSNLFSLLPSLPPPAAARFELFGYDFLIDEDLRVYLVEVNTNPFLGFQASSSSSSNMRQWGDR